MIIILFLVLLSAFAYEFFFPKKSQQKWLFLFILLGIVFLEALKVESGVDYWNYYNHYYFLDIVPTLNEQRYEIGYSTIVRVFRYIGFSYWQFLLVFFTVLYALVYSAFKKLTTFPLTALAFYFGITIGMMGSNRQMMAVALLLFAFAHYYRKALPFIVLILVAATFHSSVLLMLIVPLLWRKLHYNYFAIALIAIIIFQLTNLNKVFLELLRPIVGDQFVYYLLSDVELFNFTFLVIFGGVIRRILPIALLISFRKKLEKYKYYQGLLNIHWISLLFYFFSINNFVALTSRLSLYFIIFECITYSLVYILIQHWSVKFKLPLYIIGVLLITYMATKGMSYFPELFVPYRTLLISF